MKIVTVEALRHYIKDNSGFEHSTIRSVLNSLGYISRGSLKVLKELSAEFIKCAEHGADKGFSGFSFPNETISFFVANREDIVKHMENMAEELGTDIIAMVQGFGVFRNTKPPTPGQVGKALWDSGRTWPELSALYNVFAWYALEEIARTWYRYLEDNPAYHAELAA
jgi:hypothetical protein